MSFRCASSRPLLNSTQRIASLSSHFKPYGPPSVVLPNRLRLGHIRTMASIPSSMKAILIDKTGGTEVLQYKTDVPVPTPIDGQLLVKNDFIGVNYIDTYFRTGLYPAPQFPYILGREGAGTVVAVGPGTDSDLAVGDKVLYMGEGAYSQYTLASAAKTLKLPAGLDAKTAAAAFLQGMTALTLVRESHPVQKGDWVLVHAAAGGTGLWLCGLLAAIGARTIGTVSTVAKAEAASRAGAEHVVNYAHEDVEARVRELTGGAGCAAVFDGVGKATFDLSLACVARKGSLVSFGNASGAVPPFAIARLSAKNARVLRPTLVNYIVTREELDHYATELFDFILGRGGKDGLEVSVHDVYPLSEVARAHQDLEGRKTSGKLLLDPEK
ncbi:hypothetical protein F5Y15DRAFT_20646 [Xylariaceae sp. FL0016]|nr:hypothetical protein F5Y15DRAFT_20646 [Xylariaceae sp. FL0016]